MGLATSSRFCQPLWQKDTHADENLANEAKGIRRPDQRFMNSSKPVATPAVQYVLTFIIALCLWLLLVGHVSPDELLVGSLVAVTVSLLAAPRLGILAGIRLHPAAPLHLARFLLYFARALVHANLDMARRILSPIIPLQPALVEVQTRLQSPLGRLVLANSITLTPGTLSVDVQGDRILVHWVDCTPGDDLETATRRIAEAFERHLGGFLK